MRKARFTEEQMVAIIREADRDPVSAVAKRHGISEQTIYTWRKRFGGFQANEVRRLKQLEAENARLKKLVTAYVMTTTTENKRALTYKGILAEFFQRKEGQFEYVVLRSCSSYFLTFDDASPQTGTHKDLFSHHPERAAGAWDFLQIEGPNIANILFDPSPQIVETKAGTEALEKAIKKAAAIASAANDEAAAPQTTRTLPKSN
jgi:putative transposase